MTTFLMALLVGSASSVTIFALLVWRAPLIDENGRVT
jgi:hypothetical protein